MNNTEQKHILIFTFHGERFAVDATAVKEMVWLPELTSTEEVPAHVPGVFNLRGEVIQAVDIDLLFGRPRGRYLLTDRVVVLDKARSGIIVNDINGVVSVHESEIEPALKPSAHFVEGEAKVGEEIVMLLDHGAIVEAGESGVHSASPDLTAPPGPTPDEFAVFHSRFLALMQPLDSLTIAGLRPLAVIGLNDEFYGIDLETVREFSNVGAITPVPCTPSHIVGDMNLRGDILTLVDIRGMLNVPARAFHHLPGVGFKEKAIVVQINELLAGVMVDEVIEVIYLDPSEIRPAPLAVGQGKEYVSGEAMYAGKMLSILDLKKLLTMDELVVDDEA